VLWNERQRLASSSGLHVTRIEHLLNRYGSCIKDLLALVATDPTLGEPLSPSSDYLRAEVVYATSHEGALHVDDVLTRRTRISIEEWDRGTGSAREVATLMAGVLGWDDETINRETEHYILRVEAERASQQQPDDQTADAARLGAPDIVPLRGDPRKHHTEATAPGETLGTVHAIRSVDADAK
jgi:glycerol-3-phosphate dehydrogenase